MQNSPLFHLLATITLLGTLLPPLFGFFTIGGKLLLGSHCSERFVRRTRRVSLFTSLFFLCGLCAVSSLHGGGELFIHSITWFSFHGSHFNIDFIVDSMALIFLGLSFLLAILTADFSESYLHQDPGYARFFLLFLLACFGISVVLVSDHLGVTLIGWECLGITSALLVAFFHTRNSPVQNALRIFTTYRAADLGLLGALMVSHHWIGESSFRALNEHAPLLPAAGLLTLGGCLMLSALGKASLLPFFPWLPKAMEGPTPSSALFYGAFSVHAGPYLLLRASSVWDASPILSAILVVLGVTSAVFASYLGRVRADIKTSLAYASLVQLSFIVAEIGLHWYSLAILHTAGHMCLRTYQFLRAPSAIHDLHVQARVGVPNSNRETSGLLTKVGFYRFALNEGGVYDFYLRWLILPILALAERCARIERRTDALTELSIRKVLRIPSNHELR